MRYLLKRFALLVLTGWVAITINFALPRLMPGNPATAMLAKFPGLTPNQIGALKQYFGLNSHQNILIQYFHYLGNTLTGNLGKSMLSQEPVSRIIGQDLPWTLVLVGVASIGAAILATALGIISAYKRGSWVDTLVVPANVMLSAMPQFGLGIILLYFLAYRLGWFPVAGNSQLGQQAPSIFTWHGFTQALHYAALPGITLGLCSMGIYCLLMRNSMVSVMQDDYVKFARAKGLAGPWIAYRYAARNAILPVFTSFAMALGFVVAGAIFIEEVFSYPGIAYELLQAVLRYDYVEMQGIFLIIVLAVLIANFLADFFYVLLDPRIRQEARA